MLCIGVDVDFGIEQSSPSHSTKQKQASNIQLPLPEQSFGQTIEAGVGVGVGISGVSPGQLATHTPSPTSGIGARPWANESKGNNRKNNNEIRSDLIKK